MEKKYRLRKNEDFKKVYRTGKKFGNRNFILFRLENELDYSRIGFSVSKRIGNSVTRNKVKRRLREIYRMNFDNIKNEYDIIIIPKGNVIDMDYRELNNSMIHVLKISGLLIIG